MPEESSQTNPLPPDQTPEDATRPISLVEKSEKTQPVSTQAAGQAVQQPLEPAKTAPVKVAAPDAKTAASEEPAAKRKKRPIGRIILLGLLLIIALGALGGYLGYRGGIQARIARQQSQVAVTAATYFQWGLDDLNNGRFSLARARFEYVISLDPNFPGVKEKLAESILAMSRTEVPTEVPPTATAVLTPTPDLRGEAELFKQIQQNLVAKSWDAAIVAIEALRTKNLNYQTVDVDGMYYIALRYRGIDRILRLGDLEGGMYDLALVERFGPLDKEADSYRLWARYYQAGASFWEVDWQKAYSYFVQVAPFLPMLRDASTITAIDRMRQSGIEYAKTLVNDDPCKASKLLAEVLANNYRNATAEPLATHAANQCSPATETPKPTVAVFTGTPTRAVTLAGTPTVTKTSGPTATPGAATATPGAPSATPGAPSPTTAPTSVPPTATKAPAPSATPAPAPSPTPKP